MDSSLSPVGTFDVFVPTAVVFLASKPEPAQSFPSIKSLFCWEYLHSGVCGTKVKRFPNSRKMFEFYATKSFLPQAGFANVYFDLQMTDRDRSKHYC